MAQLQEEAQIQQWLNEGITVPLGSTGELQIIKATSGSKTCTITVKNTDGANAFDAFVVSVRPTISSPWTIIANADLDFTSPTLPMRYASASPVGLAAGANVMFQIETGGIDSIKIEASNDTAAGTANLYYSFGV